MTKLKTLSLGSFAIASSPTELLLLCIKLLDELDPKAAERHRSKKRIRADAFLRSLLSDINRFVPPFTFFGHHPTDQANYGVWIDLGALHTAEESGRLTQVSGSWRGLKSAFVLDIKDGLTLYRRKGKKVIWSAT